MTFIAGYIYAGDIYFKYVLPPPTDMLTYYTDNAPSVAIRLLTWTPTICEQRLEEIKYRFILSVLISVAPFSLTRR